MGKYFPQKNPVLLDLERLISTDFLQWYGWKIHKIQAPLERAVMDKIVKVIVVKAIHNNNLLLGSFRSLNVVFRKVL